MGYVDQNLISGEVVQYHTGQHWVTLVAPIGAGFFLGLLSLAAFLYIPFGFGVGLALLLVAGLLVASAFLARSSAEFAVTNKRVILKVGFIRRRSLELLLNKIESIGVDEGLLGRMLSYGTIVVRGTGSTMEPFAAVRCAAEFRRQVQEQIEHSQTAMGARAGS
jgi:uncharacterized membrane protein YdbT with pleckstrin-like domain